MGEDEGGATRGREMVRKTLWGEFFFFYFARNQEVQVKGTVERHDPTMLRGQIGRQARWPIVLFNQPMNTVWWHVCMLRKNRLQKPPIQL